MISRRMFLAAPLALLPFAARAEGGKAKEIMQAYSTVIEWWDRQGLFHLVNVDLLFILNKEGIKIGKQPLEKIHKRLASLPWEEFSAGNPAVTIKNVALECAKADATAGPFVTDVLIAKLLVR